MVGRLNDIVTAAVVVDATNKIKSSAEDGVQQQVQTTTKANQQPARIRPVEAKTEAKGEKTDVKIKDPKAADSLKRKQEIEEQEKREKLVPGSLTEEAVNNMTNALNKLMDKTNVNLEFRYNKEVDVMSVKLLEKGTDKVIKEFPPEEMVENMIKARDWLGAFIDKTI